MKKTFSKEVLNRMPSTEDTSKETILETMKCITCGFCLVNCPTYKRSYDEARSPRGRLALIKYITTEGIAPPKPLQECMQCGICEKSCPVSIEYISCVKYALKNNVLKNNEIKYIVKWLKENAENVLERDIEIFCEENKIDRNEFPPGKKLNKNQKINEKNIIFLPKIDGQKNNKKLNELKRTFNVEVIDPLKGWFVNSSNFLKIHFLMNYEGAKNFVKEIKGHNFVVVEDRKIARDLQKIANNEIYFCPLEEVRL